MGRSTPEVARVTSATLSSFTPLWVESRVSLGQSEDVAERSAREGRLHGAVERDDVRVYLASVDDEPAGFVVVVQSPLSGMTEEGSVWIEQIYVRPEFRHGGVGKALLLQVSRFAEHTGVTHVVSCVPTGDKESNRYFARLGFAGAVTVRGIPSGNLSRKLTAQAPQAAQVLSPVLRRRRTLRARAGARLG